jgi:hypothetical protein
LNIKIASERKADGKILYFFDDEVMNKYIADNGGENDYEFMGFQVVPFGEEVIDTDSWRAGFMELAQGTGIDVKSLKENEIHGIDDPEETEEECEKRMEEAMAIKNRAVVVKFNKDGTIEETGEDVEEFAKAKQEYNIQQAIKQLKEKCTKLGMDPESIMGEGTDDERFNRLADAVWEKMKENGEIPEDATLYDSENE